MGKSNIKKSLPKLNVGIPSSVGKSGKSNKAAKVTVSAGSLTSKGNVESFHVNSNSKKTAKVSTGVSASDYNVDDGTMQGYTMVGDKHVVVQTNEENGNGQLLFIDPETGDSYGFDIDENIGHANDIEYNPDKNQIVIPYKKAGLLIGSRGNQGGYKLARAPHLITLKEIIEVSETSLFEKQNEGNLIKEILKGMDQKIDDYFSSITLSSLVDKQIASYGNSYYI